MIQSKTTESFLGDVARIAATSLSFRFSNDGTAACERLVMILPAGTVRRDNARPPNRQLKCDAHDTTGSTIFFFKGAGDKYPSSVGRDSRFSGSGFSVSGIDSLPSNNTGAVSPNLGMTGKRKEAAQPR